MKTRLRFAVPVSSLAILLSLSTLTLPLSVPAQGTAFVFQGRLSDTNGPVNGTNDFQFALYDAAANGNPVGSDVNASDQAVNNGLFAVALDFGAAPFKGASRWLEIRVRPGDSAGAYTTLAPRQELTPAPYAIYSALAGNLPDTATQNFNGTITFGGLGGAPFLVASSTKVNNLNADLLDGFDSSAFWKLLGNAGTAPGVNFLGTTDNQPLEFKVNNARALRLEPTANGPNIIGGNSGNTVTPGAYSTVIAGGADNIASGSFATIGGGSNNTAAFMATIAGGRWNNAGPSDTVGGGVANEATGGWATVAGGVNNIASGLSSAAGGGFFNHATNSYATIAGGWGNTAGGAGAFVGGGGYSSGGSPRGNTATGENAVIGGGRSNRTESTTSFIGGGYGNFIRTNAASATISGGYGNVIEAGAEFATIAGGLDSSIGTNSIRATIGGGWANHIAGTTPGYINGSTISGGYDNEMKFGAGYSTIGGGAANTIGTNVNGGTISGGIANRLNADRANIGGGWANTLQTNSEFAVISGGVSNLIRRDAKSAVIAGGNGNDIGTNAANSAIGGGTNNTVQSYASFATIGGGVDHSVAGTHGTIAGGEHGTIEAEAGYATIGGGSDNAIQFNADYSTIAGGDNHIIRTNATWSAIGGGANNVIETNANYAVIPGGSYALARHHGEMVHASGRFAGNGDAQTSLYVLRRSLNSSTPGELFLDGASLRMKVPDGATWTFEAFVVARSSTGDSAGYRLTGVVENVGGAMGGTFQAAQVLREDVAAWDVSAGVDNVNDALIIEVTGTAGTTIRWVASVRTVEVVN